MRVHVALHPAEFPDAPLSGRTALAIDVLRASQNDLDALLLASGLRRGLGHLPRGAGAAVPDDQQALHAGVWR